MAAHARPGLARRTAARCNADTALVTFWGLGHLVAATLFGVTLHDHLADETRLLATASVPDTEAIPDDPP
ncbi:hypothetical protein ACHZ98_35425 [Streptomyces sp. MAR4 CNY-716]